MEIKKNGYETLLLQVQKVIQQTQKDVVQTVNRSKVVMAWQIGQEIDQHFKINLKSDDTIYGKNLLRRLAKDTEINERVLYKMHAFYETYPTLPKSENDLSWSHYRELAAIKSAERRKIFEELTVKNNLNSDQLQQAISEKKPRTKIEQKLRDTKNSKPKPTKLKVARGQLFTYKIANLEDSDATLIDLGFNIFTDTKSKLPADTIVATKKSGEKFLLKKSNVKSKSLHTYKAYLERIVDGDTIHVILDLGFKTKHREILRLTQINAAEANTPQGKKATAGLQKILKDVPFLIVKTNKTDIYGRYLADVFFDEKKKEMNPQKVADSGVYLSQLLLERGLVEVF
jgi:endonuclease YncB( thermonuclease family)